MSNTILTLSESDTSPSVQTSNRDSYRVRQAVRAVVMDTDGSVALLYARARDYYKLPGGGIEEDEDIALALVRELQEEIGSAAKVDQELGIVLEWRDSAKLKQISTCFTARLVGARGKPTFTDEEIAEGFEVVWTPSIDEAIRLVSASMHSDDIRVSFMTQRDTAILQAATQA